MLCTDFINSNSQVGVQGLKALLFQNKLFFKNLSQEYDQSIKQFESISG